ncbi:DUF2269 domain-containing protein [Paenibacillus sp. J5C_2022]|uniref:DUF2269 domain-containing protein n=1 Tax=Paenibacillus sp. J5C2022 TaxID=2977129 RepID=UPI0021D1DFC9|nr:DUF2269 domain-containing protein [Paenibacillus sp. J5C2022]MCU6710488.1 DUF2269 domain-containing protein [Paenibacillus sp. J5C2022]
MNVWLTLHLVGVLFMVGNVITAAFWKIRADLTGKPSIIHHTVRNVMIADYAFTIPGLVLIITSGAVMAGNNGVSLLGFNWLTLSLILFAMTGLIWLAIFIPLQNRMIRHSHECMKTGAITTEYRLASRQWAIYGVAATLLPIVILYLMVMKGF